MGYPSVVWQQQKEKALIITYNNTHLFQKPIPVWDPDYTTTFTTRFRPIPLVDDYNPTYIDPDCGRDTFWVTELYNQGLLQFQYVIDDNDHYNKTVHENPPITHNKKTRALIGNWQMNDGTNHPVFPNPLGTENIENCAESIPQSLLDERQFLNVLITKNGEPDCIPLSTNINLKTQILHRIRLKKFVPNQPLEDNFREERLLPDEEIVIPQDDLYTITWETNFGEQLATRGSEPIPASLPNGERLTTAKANADNASENEADYIITTDRPNDVNDTVHSRDKRMKSDVSNANEDSDATRNENSDWPDSAVYHKNPEKSLPDLSERQKNDANFSERNSANDSDAQKSPKRGDDIIVPEISQNDEGNENLSPRGGRYNLRPNPNPNYSEDFRY